MSTLTAEEIERSIKAIDRVADNVSKMEWTYERLTNKREKLLLQAVVCYWKSIAFKLDYLYNIRLNYSTYEYDCGMLNENLTKELISLDGVISNGNDDIRNKRKEQVKRVLTLQDKITELHKRAVELSVFYRRFVSQQRYQSILEPDEPEVVLPSTPIPDGIPDGSPGEESEVKPPKETAPQLKRKKSVHTIPILSPAEFENMRRSQKESINPDVMLDSALSEVLDHKKEKRNERKKEKREEKKRMMEEQERRKKEKMEEEKRKKEEEEEKKRKEEERRKELEQKKREEEERRKESEKRKREEEEERRRESEKRKREEEERKRELEQKKMEEERSDDNSENMEVEEESDEDPDIEVSDDDDQSLNNVKSTYTPKYQWLRQGNSLVLMLLDVDFDQKSLRCITHNTKPTPKIIIKGYRIEKAQADRGYYGLFYNMEPRYQYIPFTTVISLPDVPVDIEKAPRAMYYDDQNVLQIAYTIMEKPKKGSKTVNKSSNLTPVNPFYPTRDSRNEAPKPRYSVYDPRYSTNDEEEEYSSPYYRNPYNTYRQQRNPYGSPSNSMFYPFFGGNVW